MIVGHIGGAGSPYEIQKSLRFRASASVHLSRTPAGAGNQKTWTWSGWVKLGNMADTAFFQAYSDNNNRTQIGYGANGINWTELEAGSTTGRLYTNAVYRDPSAWYHIVCALDTTQATASNRMKLYVNGQQVTSFAVATYPPQNANWFVNGVYAHYLGRDVAGAASLDGYLTEVNFIDGQALTPSSFGETSTETGAWIPKKYTGTYGTNGFYLPFNDGSTLGNLTADRSGNGNNWTANNISLTAGATYDSMLDVPTMWADGGNGRGNYCTLNPLNQSSFVTLQNANLRVNGNTATNSGVALATIGMSTGKWYWETTVTTVGGLSYAGMGISAPQNNAETYFINAGATGGCGWRSGGGSGGVGGFGTTSATYPTFTTGDIIGVAVDFDNGALYYSKNGVWENSGVPTSGSSKTGAFNIWTAGAITGFPAGGGYNGSVNDLNLGQRPFAYTPPAGFKALCTANLPAVAIPNPKKHFDVVLATGANIKSTVEALYSDQALMVVKDRANANNWQWFNDVTGLSAILQSNTTSAETTYSVPTGSSVGYGWKAGGAPVTNNAGSIQSQVSANPQAGFSIVTYTGTGVNATVGHGLGVAPKMVIVKNRQAGNNWRAWHVGLNVAAPSLYLNTVNAQISDTSIFNGTNPTASVVHLGNHSDTNAINTYVAYCFAEIPGYSKIGSYTGNGSADGPFVYCGFRPKFVLTKRTNTTGSWVILDAARETANPEDYALYANLSDAETLLSAGGEDFTANGFKLRGTDSNINASGSTYIFIAFAEAPFKFANAR